MKHFTRVKDGVQEMCYGTSIKEIAERFGISPYMFKQEGWEKTEDKSIIRFKLVSAGITVNQGSIFRGPFDDETFERERVESETNMKDSLAAYRKKNFRVKIEEATDANNTGNDAILLVSHNGRQWTTTAFNEAEAVKILTALEMWLHKRRNK